MSQQPETTTPAQNGHTTHRFFARYYERTSRSERGDNIMNPLRREVTGEARGHVLEVGPGNGLNFAFYEPGMIERVEAIEPDSVMLRYARERAVQARVPINLIQAAAENLPFADESFDSVVATLVFCSVSDPVRGLSEVWRVLKPGGALLMIEHVRAQGAVMASVQNIITPMTRRLLGNCHWNRETEKTVLETGFKIEQRRALKRFMMPFIVLHAVK
ncbi:MAG TPA: class I SAM-dependent methyltransferase [Ktedonobacteraceae bacterium]|jgi:ubiquinone/menaquinone biosynthesis C-methylase UbiE|nr:class I SAM-dependent methyltransferase [Ktedonobacteraceae bacterium]